MQFTHEEFKFTMFFEAEEVGYIEYEIKDGLYYLNSAVVHSKFEGQGNAGKILDYAAEYLSSNNLKAIPICPYIIHKFDKGGFEQIDAR